MKIIKFKPGAQMQNWIANICGITETSTEDNNLYLWPFRMLTNLLVLDISSKNFQKDNTWMGRLEPEYLDCLA